MVTVLCVVLAACVPSATEVSSADGGASPTTLHATTTSAARTTTTATATTATTATTTTKPEPTTTTTEVLDIDCSVEVIGATEDFYRKACTQNSISILAGADVENAALRAAAERMANLLAERDDLAKAVAESIDHVAIVDSDEAISDLPDFENLYTVHPGTNWKRLGRSFPGSYEIAVPAGAEENLLCSEQDRYEDEDMFIHAFAWTIRRFGIATADPKLDRAIEDAYGWAIAAGLWQNTLVEVNSDEYWAEGTQSFFDANGEAADETDQVHNHVNTRDELRSYDPTLYRLLASVFGETDWRPSCP